MVVKKLLGGWVNGDIMDDVMDKLYRLHINVIDGGVRYNQLTNVQVRYLRVRVS